MDDRVLYRDKLIMVMGMQRSGTTALLYALGQDPSVQVENEEPDGPLYDQYRLRSAKAIHSELMRIKRRVLLKPVVEAEYREIDDVIREFIAYDPLVAWIYRDPIDVWSSAKNTFHLSTGDIQRWIKKWTSGNESALRSMSGPFRDRIRSVRYDDLIQNRAVFDTLCEFLRLEPRNNLFWREDPKKGHQSLSALIRSLIEEETTAIIGCLDGQRIRPAETTINREDEELSSKSSDRFTWTLRTNNNASAEMTKAAEPAFGTRFTIVKSTAVNSWDVQAVWPSMSVDAYRRYTASCWIRSDRRRIAHLVLAQDHEPWEELGFSQPVEVTSGWQHVGVEIFPNADEPTAALRWDLGAEPGDVEISDIRIGSPLFVLHELILHSSASGRLLPIPENPSAVRVSIDQLPSGGDPIAVQVVVGHMSLQAGQRYTFAVSLRSASPREIRAAIGQSSAPWTNLGFCQVIEITPEWTTHIFDFKAERGGEARLYFEMGQNQSDVDIRSVSLFLSAHRVHHVITNNGGQCDIEFPPDNPTSVRACARPVRNPADPDVQLFVPDVKVLKNHRYAVSFVARAESSREIGFGVGENAPPWTGLGLYHYVVVGRHWQPYYYEFIVKEDCDNARVLFDVGRSSVPVEFADVMIRPMNREAFVSSSDSRTTFNYHGANVPSSIQ